MPIAQFHFSLRFTRIILAISIVVAVIVMFLYAQIDSLVNHDLYNYALQFNSAWYNPYSVYTKLIYVCLFIPVAISGAALALSFWKELKKNSQEENLGQKPFSRQAVSQKAMPLQSVQNEVQDQAGAGKPQEETTYLCQNCCETYTRPLVTLNFVNGKPIMVNTCPYCNEPVESSGGSKAS